MQTLILILIATLSFSLICLGVFCYTLNNRLRDLQNQLVDARKEYRGFNEWAKLKIFAYRENRGQQGGNSSDNTCHKCPIFD